MAFSCAKNHTFVSGWFFTLDFFLSVILCFIKCGVLKIIFIFASKYSEPVTVAYNKIST